MYFTYFLLLWTFGIIPVKSQVHLKPINYYEPIPTNGLSPPSIIKSFKPFSGPLIISYPENTRELSWVKNPRTQLQKKAPQRQQFVLYYPPPKPNQNPYNNRFQNIKTNNLGLNNNNIFINHYQKNKNNNKVPKELIYETNLSSENVEPQRGKVEFENGEIEKNRGKYRIRNQEQKKNFSSGNEKDIYPPVPNSFMEPPGFETSDYRIYKKAGENLENGKNKNEDYQNQNLYKNHRMNGEEEDFDKDFDDRAPYIRDHAPENESEELEESSEVEKDESEAEQKAPKKISNASEISPDGDRVDFQIQGHQGPKTYVFGFDTGDGKNRQYRLEERFKDGTVKGQYGYYDARGKLRAIKYIARPLEGYEEKHHESLVPSSSN